LSLLGKIAQTAKAARAPRVAGSVRNELDVEQQRFVS
jgi:hypothetical protein